MERAALVFDRSRMNGDPVSVLAFDLDRFKRVNDVFGHAMGDRVLILFASVLSRTLRPTDLAGRLGGEEFVALLSGCEAAAAEAIAGRVRGAFCEAGHFVDGHRIAATVSVGAAVVDADATLASALARADEALYRAKEMGRNRVVLAIAGDDPPPGGNVIRVA
jgi:diguanylate cyclase (GGDEF)-like protein